LLAPHLAGQTHVPTLDCERFKALAGVWPPLRAACTIASISS
jgi:hypothetical protein